MKMKFFISILLISMYCGSKAQAPINDDPCGAIEIPVVTADVIATDCIPTQLYSYSNASLTTGVPSPSCSGPSDNIRDVWYKCIVPASGKLVFNITDASTDFILSAYTASSCSSTFTEIGCNDDTHGGMPYLIFTNLTPGITIYFRLFNYTASVITDGSLKICAADYLTSFPVVDNTTKVGVGVANPLGKLDIAGTGIFRDNLIAGKNIDARGNITVTGNIETKGNITTTGNLVGYSLQLTSPTISGYLLSSDNVGHALWTAPAPAHWTISGNDIYNNNSGNVGIGTSAPAFPLNFANTLGDKISFWGNTANVSHYGLGIQSNLFQMYSDASTADIAFGYGTSSNFTERLRLINNGGYDGMTLKGRLILKNGSADPVGGGSGVWLYKADNSALLGFMGAQNNQNIGFFGGPGGWGFVYDALNSRVGIGTATPSQALQVTGNILASGTITPSDARYKKNIALISNPLIKLQQLNGVTYNYRSADFPEMKFNDQQQVGLIAQEVEKVFPQLVFTDDKGYKAVDYVKLIPVLLEGIKQLNDKIIQQQQQIDVLIKSNK